MLQKNFQKALLLGLVALITPSTGFAIATLDAPPTFQKAIDKDFTSVAKTAIPAVVSITVKGTKERAKLKNQQESDSDSSSPNWLEKFFGQPEEKELELSTSQGSGFIISEDGYIMTNRHVVDNTNEITVILNDGREFTGELVGQDTYTDIAILKINANNLPYVVLGNSDNLEIGQWVIAIGTPLGLQASLTTGVVSAKGRNNLDLSRIEDFIQTDAVLNRGNSGGPLLNLDSEVIGVNTAIASNMGAYMGIGFAVPSNIAKNAMEQLIEHGSVKRGYIGILLQQMDKDLASAFGLQKTQGIVVSEVVPGSPAERASLKRGDVITRYNSVSVNNIGSFRTAIALMPPESKVKLVILRNGKEEELTVTVGDASTNNTTTETKQPAPKHHEAHTLGLKVENLTPSIAESLKIKDNIGVVVTGVSPGSIAKWAGLRPGVVIIEVNQKKIENVEDFQKALQNADNGKPLLLLTKEKGVVKFLSLKFN